MSLIDNKSERVTCPFDKAHTIERRRLQTHILKCKKNLPPNHDFVQCMFWSLHFVRKHELDKHHETCEHGAAKLAQRRQELAEPSRFKQPRLIENVTPASSYSDESWDTSDQPAFKPEVLQANAPYMITPQGLPKAQRREFRENERKRIRDQQDSKVETNTEWNETDNSDNPLPRKPDTRPFQSNTAQSKFSHEERSSASSSSSGYSSMSSSRTPSSNEAAYSSYSPYSTSFTMGGPSSRRDDEPTAQSRSSAGRPFVGGWATNTRQTSHPYRYDNNDFPSLP